MVMKSLTCVTIVFMLPTLVSSIYGMNINLPFQGHVNAFAIVMGLSGVLAAVIGAIFYLLSRARKF